MSKVNPSVKKSGVRSQVRLAGGAGMQAAKQDSISQLRRLVLACLLWENNAYVDGKTAVEQMIALIPECDPRDVANLATEARVLQKLRHVPLLLAVEMLKHKEHKELVSQLLPRVITRADMLTDFMAIYKKQNNLTKIKKIAAQAKKGLSASFSNFKEYHFAKYDREGEIKIRDVMFLCHPKPESAERAKLFERIANRTLDIPMTWEVLLSAPGANKKEVWTKLITEKALGALAFIRNLRNMKDANVDHNVITEGLKALSGQMLLPNNFVNAVKYAPEFKAQLQELMLKTYSDLPKMKGRSIFIIDVSGSMGSTVSAKSELTRMQVAFAMAMLAREHCESVDIYLTAGGGQMTGKRLPGDAAHTTVKVDYPSRGFDLIAQMDGMHRTMGYGGIYTRQCLAWIESQIDYVPDRIIVFSDSQDCDYGSKLPKPFGKHNYIVDVSAHRNGVNFKGLWTCEVSGWSEHFLSFIGAYEGVENSFTDD